MQPASPPSKPPRPRPMRPPWTWLAIIGPGVLGLAADNDAGGMLSYLLTGAAHHLIYFWLELAVMAPITYLVQELALRVALATRQPYGRLLAIRFGSRWAAVNGAILLGLNLCNLVTEFVGMAAALNWFGLPWTAAVCASLALVAAVTTLYRRYGSLERLLLVLAGLNLAWVAALCLSPLTVSRVTDALIGGSSANLGFLGLALAGNAIAPWMIYWQQNAVWAGKIESLAQGRTDIRIGVFAQVAMAALVMLIGGVASTPADWSHPLAWLAKEANPWVARAFALGLFDAGFMAACTMTLAAAWMLRETVAPANLAPDRRRETPTQGQAGPIHWATLVGAAAITLWPGINPGAVALWAQAFSALWMPASLIFLGLIAQDSRLMGAMRMRDRRRLGLAAATLLFLTLAVWTLRSSL